MTHIFSSSDGNEPSTPRSTKKLIVEERYFSKEPIVPGKRPRSFASGFAISISPPDEKYPFELGIAGLDVYLSSPLIGIAFDTELLRDGYTDEQRIRALSSELKREVQRMRGEPSVQQSTANALAMLKNDLCALHGLGYTIEDLQRLVVGTLRISITQEELLGAMFP